MGVTGYLKYSSKAVVLNLPNAATFNRVPHVVVVTPNHKIIFVAALEL